MKDTLVKLDLAEEVAEQMLFAEETEVLNRFWQELGRLNEENGLPETLEELDARVEKVHGSIPGSKQALLKLQRLTEAVDKSGSG